MLPAYQTIGKWHKFKGVADACNIPQYPMVAWLFWSISVYIVLNRTVGWVLNIDLPRGMDLVRVTQLGQNNKDVIKLVPVVPLFSTEH